MRFNGDPAPSSPSSPAMFFFRTGWILQLWRLAGSFTDTVGTSNITRWRVGKQSAGTTWHPHSGLKGMVDLELDDCVDPVPKVGDPGHHSRLVPLGTANAPRDDSCQVVAAV